MVAATEDSLIDLPVDTADDTAILIPTYNRAACLMKTLAHLERQTVRGFDVVIVDDGSSDDTAALLDTYRVSAPFGLTVLRQDNAGPATARNRGVAAITRPITIMIGDDTYPAEDFVAMHVRHHRADRAANSVAIGLTRWYEAERPATPLMRWLDQAGLQFAFGDLLGGTPPSWRHFYTSNLSAKTAFLQAHPFSESFPGAAMEDIELGYRLDQGHGLRMTFLRDAVVAHDHPVTYRQSCRRMISAGQGVHAAGQIWPAFAMAPVYGLRRRTLEWLARTKWARESLAMLGATSQHWACPNPLMAGILRLHATIGYVMAARRSDDPAQPLTPQADPLPAE